ncbi:hypothetical protein FBU30_004101 [Linnemannia zychae]|nr:hypothetical protein FBU30_004101 [Linnemannia zychae]
MGARADLIWRTLIVPERNWAVVEAAPEWDPISDKYRSESAFKLPRQLHDILTARSSELGGPDQLRYAFVTGLIFGSKINYVIFLCKRIGNGYPFGEHYVNGSFSLSRPVIQRVLLCWGTSGDNVTRLMKAHERRIRPSVKVLSESLLAIHELLLFRSSTVRLKTAFDHALKDLRKAKHQAKRDELQAGPLKLRLRDCVAKLLYSSP